jgi:outer membrane protein assembly factor BamB
VPFVQWKWSAVNGATASSAALTANGVLVLVTSDGDLVALDAAGAGGGTAKTLWQVSLGDSVRSSPALGADGTVFVTTIGKRLLAVR